MSAFSVENSHDGKTFENYTRFEWGVEVGVVTTFMLRLFVPHEFDMYRYLVVFYVDICVFNPLNPGSDQYLISPYNNTAESFIKTMRIRQMITNLRSFDC